MRYYFTAFCIPTSLVLSTGRVRRRIDGPAYLRLADYLRGWQRPLRTSDHRPPVLQVA